MRRRIFTVICACCAMMCMSTDVYASEPPGIMPIITYDGKEQEFFVEDSILLEGKLPDLFTEFKDCIPGDVRVQTVKVEAKNLGNNIATISLLAENPDAKYEDLMKNITCQITSDDLDITTSIWDRIILADFNNNESKMITMTLTFPADLDNRFQNFIGQVDWYLDIEMFPIDDGNGLPTTGDESHVGVYVALAGSALLLAIIVLILKKKKSKKDE